MALDRLPNFSTVPPGGWQYTQRETGAVIRGGDWQDLLRKILDHRKANNLPVGAAWEAAVEFDICQALTDQGIKWCVNSSTGLGDDLYNVAHRVAIGIDKIAGTNIKECGSCAARRAAMNQHFPH